MGTTTKMESRPSKKHFKKRTDSNEAENETHRHSSKKSRGRSPQEPKMKEFRREKGFKDMPDLIETSSRKTPRVIERNSPVITKDEMHSKRRHSGIVENSNKKTLHQKKGFQEKYDVAESAPRRSNRGNQRDSLDISNKRRDDKFPVDDEMHSKRCHSGIVENSNKKTLHSGIVENSNKKTLHQKKGFQEKYDVAESAPRRSNRGNQRDSLDISNKRRDDKFPVDDNVNGKKRQAGLRDNSDKEFPGQKKSFQSKTDRAGQKKGFEENSDAVDSPKRKKKRVMRIDPHDISNKRIDDGVSIDGKKVEKKVDTEANNEVSMNAQFRAIQPSPSILSFVEDNLLGRRRLIELRRAGYNIDLSAPLDNVPLSTSSERERIEESVFRNRLSFFAAAKIASSFPPAELPEIAFAGRSNVGKSSLLNALTRQWGVVRTSDKPGLTQTINFFNLGPKLRLVDLPGYGFAYAKEEVKDAWEELVKEYVSTRVGLKRVCLLIDTKWGMKPRDRELIDLMERSQTKYQIVLTKTDTVFPIDVARRAMQIEESLNANRSSVQPLMMVSSKTGAGIRSLRTVLGKVLRFAKV